jgi:hypothetical protein
MTYEDLNKDQQVKAIEYGYSGFFATPTKEQAFEALDYARAVGDSLGIMMAMSQIQNINAIAKAVA